MPFTLEDQRVLVAAVNEALLARGPARMLAFREGYPDPRAPANATERFPYVDISAVAYDMLGDTSSANWQPDVQSLLTLSSRMLQLGERRRRAGGRAGRRGGMGGRARKHGVLSAPHAEAQQNELGL